MDEQGTFLCRLNLQRKVPYSSIGKGTIKGQYHINGSGPFSGPQPIGFLKAIRGAPGARLGARSVAKSVARSGVRSGLKQPRFRDIFVSNSLCTQNAQIRNMAQKSHQDTGDFNIKNFNGKRGALTHQSISWHIPVL